MPDRVSVGSPGGAGGDEIEVAVRAFHGWPPETVVNHRDRFYVQMERAIAALDAARRSSQGDPTVPWQQWNDEVNTRINAQIELADARAEIKRLRSPQGEEHEAPPPGRFVSIAANKAMAAPVSGTEPGIGSWMCPRCGETAVTPDRHECSVSGTEPDTAKLIASIRFKVRQTIAAYDGNWDENELADRVDHALAGFSVDAGKAEENSVECRSCWVLPGEPHHPGCPEAGSDGR